MKGIVGLIKTTVVGGLLFLLPIVLVALILREAVRVLDKLSQPVVAMLPTQSIAGVTLAGLISIAALILLCFLAGLIARTRLGHDLGDVVENMVLRRIPGFMLIKAIAGGVAGVDTKSPLSVALARIEDAWVLGFVLERHASGLLTVFVPSAPTPAAGSVYYLTEDRVRFLDVPASAAMSCIMRLGVGSAALLDKSLPKQQLEFEQRES